MKIILLGLFTLCASTLMAQNITGKLIDSLDNSPMEMVTLSISNLKDSSFVSYSSTTKTGEFSFKRLPFEKKMVMIASIMGYYDYVKVFTLKKDETLDLGLIKMRAKSIGLGEVVVTSERQAIVINKDTITFNVEAFKVRPNAVVEELLKKLPGLQVDNDGTITVNGKSVSKVTIDGKEFFGNDPKIATQNLNADLLDKIQIFDDRENDPDHLIEDSKVSKIINLKFKKAFKKSVFGKVYAGGGSRERFESGGLINTFRDTLQISLIGVANNLSKTGFSRNDLADLGGFNRSGGSNLNNISIGGRGFGGIESVYSGGVNINNDYGKKLKLNLLYFYSDTRTVSSNSSLTQQFLNSDTLYSSSTSKGNRNENKHNIAGLIQWKPNDTYSIRYEPKFSLTNSNNTYDGNNGTSNQKSLLNKNLNATTNQSNTISFSHNIVFYKALKKKGASLNLRNILSSNPTNNNSFNNVDLTSFTADLNSDTLRRFTENDNKTFSTTLFATYRYPLNKKLTAEFTLSGDYDLNTRKLSTFDKDFISNQYDIVLENQSNNLERYQYSEKVKAGINYKFSKNISFDFALENQWIQIKNQFNRNNVNDLNQKYFNLLPTLRLVVKEFSLGYTASVQQPSVYNLQPITIQSTQLYAFTGNPLLTPSKFHRFNFGYNKYILKSQLSIFAYTSGSIDENSVVTLNNISNQGVYTSSPVNKNGSYNFNGNIGLNKSFKKKADWKINLSSSIYYNQRRNFIFLNKNEGFQDNFGFGLRQSFSINWKDKLELSPSYGINPNVTTYTIIGFSKINNTTHNFDTRYTVRWPKKVYFEGNYRFNYNPLVSAGYRKSVHFLNASVALQMFKKDKGEIKLSCYDILDQNIDIYRFASQNSVTDYQSQILKRYFLLTYMVKFNKTTTK
jgi:Outer membrane protein beta-barrel family